jgi:pimeloyl-ACP methyl ester carboxylesterase
MPTVTVNGTELYYELRGTGPAVLLIMGATGDGGHFDALAELLADEFTVVTYDRRGNGRSPVPAGWRTTSPEEQADDAAGLLEALETGPAAAFGTSSGGTFALCLVIRHPAAARGVILHEPGIAGDDSWAKLAPTLRKRLQASAKTLFDIELGTYERYLPDDETWAAIEAPVRLLVSTGSLPFFAEMTGRLGERLRLNVTTTAGTHAAYHDHPDELAETVRPFLREVSALGP